MNIFDLLLNSNRFLRSYLLKKRPRLIVSLSMQKLYAKRKPIHPYAFIRVCNEIKTINISLQSILPVLKGGVIGFNSCTDGTKEYILEFCKKYPQFTPVEYPYDVIPGNDLRYSQQTLDPNTRLDSYYNFVWSKLPKNEWIIKVDIDHVYIPEYVYQLCRLPLKKDDCVVFNRMNVHCHNGECYINPEAPFSEHGDHWLIFNDDTLPKFTFSRGWDKQGHFFAWEVLDINEYRRRIYGVLSNWHFTLVKNQRNTFHLEKWKKIKEFDFESYFNKTKSNKKMQNRIPRDMLDEQKILMVFKTFNHESKRILP